jgi:hypothetical protein
VGGRKRTTIFISIVQGLGFAIRLGSWWTFILEVHIPGDAASVIIIWGEIIHYNTKFHSMLFFNFSCKISAFFTFSVLCHVFTKVRFANVLTPWNLVFGCPQRLYNILKTSSVTGRLCYHRKEKIYSQKENLTQTMRSQLTHTRIPEFRETVCVSMECACVVTWNASVLRFLIGQKLPLLCLQRWQNWTGCCRPMSSHNTRAFHPTTHTQSM